MPKFNFCIATGTGRCGTQFLSKLLALSKDVATRHDPNPLSLTFHRYSKWFKLPVDSAGFFFGIEQDLQEDLSTAKLAIHSSAHMALSIGDLYQHFGCKVIVFYRNPAKVVSSYYGKGHYRDTYHYSDFSKAIGYQDIGKMPHHFFGRLVPNSAYFEQWNKLTTIGKLGWVWTTINQEIQRQLTHLSPADYFESRIEDFNYLRYQDLCVFLNIVPISEKDFNALSNSKTNTLPGSGSYDMEQWTLQERAEFKEQVGEVAGRLGYSVS